MESLLYKNLSSGKSIITLPKGEFKESVIIDRPCTIVGNDTILWNDTLPIISIRSSGVTLKNLRLEMINISGYDGDSIALSCLPDTIIENVEIYGGVEGNKKYYIPRSLHLGEFEADTENTYNLTIFLPEVCTIKVKSSNFKVYTANLGNGYMSLKIVTNTMSDGSMLYGEIVFISSLVRRIFVDGIAMSGVPKITNKVLYSYTEPLPELPNEILKISTRNTTISRNINPDHMIGDTSALTQFRKINLIRGQRLTVEYTTLDMKLSYTQTKCSNDIEIDPYIFLTDANNQTLYNEDMIFFGNPILRNESVCIDSNNMIHLHLDKVSKYVKKIIICYSIYRNANNSVKVFYTVKNIDFSIFSEGLNLASISLDDVGQFSNVILVEFYRHNDTWKLNPCISGYSGSLPQLCQCFGIDADY